MGVTAENLAEKYDLTREEQDRFAMESHRKATKAQQSGRFAKEIVPIIVKDKKRREIEIFEDEHIRPNVDMKGLEKLKPAFKKEGTVTAGNASGINDGAAAVVLGSEAFLFHRPELKSMAKIISWGIAGVDPNIMGIGPVPASNIALKKAGLSWSDIGVIEFNEAFAAQSLAVMRELGIDREKVNVNGGAIALGHPVGSSGARILYSLAVELRERGAEYGLASLCIGGGQGIAVIIKNV